MGGKRKKKEDSPPPTPIKRLGPSKKAGLLSSEPQTQLRSLTSWQGAGTCCSQGVPANHVETSHVPIWMCPSPSPAAEAEEEKESYPWLLGSPVSPA